MKSKPKLILLNGFAGSGKTTLTKRYTADHPLAMGIEEDELIGMIGQWTKHETEARTFVSGFIRTIAKLHLQNDKTVLIPHLLTNASYAKELEIIAKECNADYVEIYLSIEKRDAIDRLLARGTWGEPGTPPITEKDFPIIESKYTLMTRETKKRPAMISIHPVKDDIEHTYKTLLKALKENLVQ